MKTTIPSLAGAKGRAVTSTKPDATACRFALQSLWERKVDEVNALAGACLGVSAAGDDLPGDGATLPSFGLYRRTARAYEELAALADAIERVDSGTYGARAAGSR